MSSLVEGSERRQNYPVHIQNNGLTVVENVYSNSTNNEREEPATVILLLCACVLLLLKAPLPSTQKKLVAMRKVLK